MNQRLLRDFGSSPFRFLAGDGWAGWLNFLPTAELFCREGVMDVEAQHGPSSSHSKFLVAPSPSLKSLGTQEDKDLTPEQDYRVRAMGEEELELLRAAASRDGLQLASLNWILASLANHGFLTVSFDSGRRMRAVATKASYLALTLRPLLPLESVH